MAQCKIVILGAAGMLGHKMFQALRERFAGIKATAREDLRLSPFDRISLLQSNDVIQNVDVTEFNSLHELLGTLKPEFVVNCVGIIKQRKEASSAIPSITINALLPHLLADWAKGWNGRVIHFSTDCVFSGRRGAYSENDLSDAEDLYGKTKYLGETTEENGLTIRTSIIGRELVEHKSLLDWFLGQDKRGAVVRGFRRVIYSGITTNYLSCLVGDLIDSFPTLSGLYQAASEPISKYELLCLLKEAYGLRVPIIPDDIEVSDRSLIGKKFADATGFVTPSWSELAQELRTDTTPYDEWTCR